MDLENKPIDRLEELDREYGKLLKNQDLEDPNYHAKVFEVLSDYRWCAKTKIKLLEDELKIWRKK